MESGISHNNFTKNSREPKFSNPSLVIARGMQVGKARMTVQQQEETKKMNGASIFTSAQHEPKQEFTGRRPMRAAAAMSPSTSSHSYKDGRVRWFVRNTSVPASDEKGPNGIISKDVVIDDKTGVSARLFLPVDAAAAAAATGRRLPLVVYIHGGAFCSGSASGPMFHVRLC